MTRERESRVLAIVAAVSRKDRGQVTPRSTFTGDLGMDSAASLHLLVEVEDAFRISISDAQAMQMKTVGDLLAYLRGVL